MKKLMTIEALLQWAFGDELVGRSVEHDGPAGVGSAWSAFEAVAKLGCFVDGSGSPWDQLRSAQPHPDALLVAEAVKSLESSAEFEIRRPANPFPEWIDETGEIAKEVDRIVASIDADTRKGSHLVSLAITCAILKRGPDWSAMPPSVVPCSHNGKDAAWFITRKAKDSIGRIYEFEDDGFDYRRRRPFNGAYNKFRLNGSIRGAVVGRLEWQLWQSALGELHESLSGVLTDRDLAPFYADPHPWLPRSKDAMDYHAFDLAA